MMKPFTSLIVICLFLGLLSSCASKKPYYRQANLHLPDNLPPVDPSEVAYSLILAGGVSLTDASPVMEAVLSSRGNSTRGLVLLGDVVGLDDLPITADEDLSGSTPLVKTIQNLDQQFNDLYVIPGQLEWSSDKRISSSAMRSLDALFKDVKKKGRLIQPSKGCGSPEKVRLTDHTILVLVDSQWAIDAEANPAEKLRGCELSNLLEWRLALKDIVRSHPDDHIIIATHHPVFANGPTAGNYPLSSHLLPLPVLGTAITVIKSLVSSAQHFGHPAYEAYRAAFLSAIGGCENCIVVSGHEKSLQYYNSSGQHFLVAGSGSRVEHARKGDRSDFSYMSRGFVKINELHSGSLVVSFLATGEEGSAYPVWEMHIGPVRPNLVETSSDSSFSAGAYADSVWVQASTQYEEKLFLRGDFYRKAWSEKIKVPVLWLDSVHGGLVPVQMGGGNQTRSLRLENPAGEQYVIRSIDKKVTTVLPPALRGTVAENIVQDGIAASHPYGALVVPGLARAAKIFYTRPSVVYVPHQPALGNYSEEVGNGVYLFEERPGGETAGFDNFGNTPKTVNTIDLLELLAESHKHVVDQRAVLRARLFDIWLGDWDRHDDQWRWATFDDGDKTRYVPIPRDRDQVFYFSDGVLDYLASRPYFNPPLRSFNEKIDYLDGLVWAGKYFDRSFLHELTSDEFVAMGEELKSLLTDEVIGEAFRDWPGPIDAIDGNTIREKLKKRRDDLPAYAQEFYLHLARTVFIPCSEDRDVVSINALDDNRLSVSVERVSGSGTHHAFYHRIFDDSETKEIRLFGLNKADTFLLSGSGHPSMVIRLIGGTGKDRLINMASRLHVIAYDGEDGMVLEGEKVKQHLNDRPFNNSFDRMDWHLNKRFHFPLPAFYTDEGLGLTYNFWATRFGFRSDPFASRHTAALSYFFNTGAFVGTYSGEWTRVFGDIDFGLDAFITGPTFTQYYYGLGNEYIDFDQKNKFHIVKGSQIRLSPSFRQQAGFGSAFSLTPSYQYINIDDGHDEPRFIYTPQSGLTSDDFGSRQYLGITAGYHFERIDNPGFPSRGGELSLSAGLRSSLDGSGFNHRIISGEGSLYVPFSVSGTVVFATHFGADKIFGDYEFFHALTLGGQDKLRGFKRDRFAGDARFYHASDLRFKLFKSRGVIPFHVGVYGSFDYGRVWYTSEDTADNTWHTAFGGGIFIVPLELTAFRIGYMVGENDKQLNIGGALRF